MPFPEQPSRRAVVAGLATAAGLTLAGCTSDGDLPDLPGLRPEPEPNPDVALLKRVTRDESRMWELVVTTRRAHRQLRGTLKDAEAGHEAHLERLRTSVTSGSADADAKVEVTLHGARDVAKNPERALADVVVAEQELARKHAASALDAQSGPLARMIASMSAAAAQQGSVPATRAGPS